METVIRISEHPRYRFRASPNPSSYPEPLQSALDKNASYLRRSFKAVALSACMLNAKLARECLAEFSRAFWIRGYLKLMAIPTPPVPLRRGTGMPGTERRLNAENT